MIRRCHEHHDAPRRPIDCRTCRRIAIENRIVWLAVDCLLTCGYALSVDNGGDEDEISRSTDRAAVLAAMHETDSEVLIAHHDTDTRGPAGVVFVYGNDGWDVINDCASRLAAVIQPAIDYAARMEAREPWARATTHPLER